MASLAAQVSLITCLTVIDAYRLGKGNSDVLDVQSVQMRDSLTTSGVPMVQFDAYYSNSGKGVGNYVGF